MTLAEGFLARAVLLLSQRLLGVSAATDSKDRGAVYGSDTDRRVYEKLRTSIGQARSAKSRQNCAKVEFL